MAKRVPLDKGWDFLADLKWQAKLFAYDAQYGVSDGYLTVREAEKADKEFHEIIDKWIPKVEAEICLVETEMDNAPDIKEYESILNGNVLRKGRNRKAQRNGKRNADKAKRYHDSDRKHGKNYLKRNNLQNLSMEDAEFFHDKKAMDIACHDGKWIYTGKHGDDFWSKVWYTRHKKNRNNRLESAMDARERDYASTFSEKGELMDKVLPTLEDNIIFLKKHFKNEELLISKCEDYKKDILRVIHTATR